MEATPIEGDLMPQRTCEVDGCDRPYRISGHCDAHHARFRRTGSVGDAYIAPRPSAGPCTIEGCERSHKAGGLCGAHYQRMRLTGDAGGIRIRFRGDVNVRDESGRKRCTNCQEWLEESAFLKAKKGADGLHTHCYRCHRKGVMKRTYGISIEQYEEMLAEQGGVCLLCGQTNRSATLLAVDHDHSCCPGRESCGRCIRGLLCLKCNTGLGAFGDDMALLQKAMSYIQKGGRLGYI